MKKFKGGDLHALVCLIKNIAENEVSEDFLRQCWEGFSGAISDLLAVAVKSTVLRTVVVSKLSGKECHDQRKRSMWVER